MADFSALPLFTDAFLADTSHLSDAECGIYLRLLMLIWRSPGCRIPNDEAWIAKRFQRPIEISAKEVMPLIREFCKTDGNWITQKRLSREFEYVKTHSQKQSDRAKSRWNKEKNNTGAYAASHASGNAPSPSPSPSPTKKEQEDSRTLPKYAFERGVIRLIAKDLEQWRRSFPDLNLEAELEGLAGWASEQGKNWFFAVAGALKNAQRKAKLNLERVKVEAVTGANGHAVQLAQAEINKLWTSPEGIVRRRWPQDFPPNAPKPPGPYRDLVSDG